MSEPVSQSALSNAAKMNSSISIAPIENRGMLDIRGNLTDKKFANTIKQIIKVSLPSKPRTSIQKGDISILWLSIDQWLITCPLEQTQELFEKLVTGLSQTHCLIVDVSDARSIIELTGQGAREILMKGAPLDLTLKEYSPGCVRRLRFGEQAAMVHFISSNPDKIELYVFRSYANYVWNWLEATSPKACELRIFQLQSAPKI